MTVFLTIVHVCAILLLVLLVLIQSGKGAEISASFGGSSQTVFGTSGGANFFTRLTAGTAAVFMTTSVLLTIMGTESKKSVFEGVNPTQSAPTAPAPTGTAPTEAAPSGNAKPAQEKSTPAK